MDAVRRLILAGALFFSFVAHADIIEISVVPATWKLENYVGYAGTTGVVVWYTTSSCATGSLGFPSSASAADMNRFWATVMTAKASQKAMFVRYDNATSNCAIVSFGLPAGS